MADETAGIELYIQHLEALAAGKPTAAKKLLQASMDLGEPMALHAAAYQQTDTGSAVALYVRAADAGSAPSAWNLYLHYRDIDEAEAAALWLERAAELGDQDARKLLGT